MSKLRNIDVLGHILRYRYLVVEKYLVFFVVIGNTVQIRRILYGRRQYGELLSSGIGSCQRSPDLADK